MGFRIVNNCVGPCPMGCINCGKRHQPEYYCDRCEVVSDDNTKLYVFGKKTLCWDCYKEMYTQKICDDLDDTLCSSCGREAETLYLISGNEWVCEECLRNTAEEAETNE